MAADHVEVAGRIIDGGEIRMMNREYFVGVTSRWPVGTDITITATRKRPKISDLQRAYWFAVPVPILAEWTGDDEDSVHHDLMVKYGPKVTKAWRNKKTGRRRQRTRRVSIMDLNTKQMTDLIDTVRRDFGNEGVVIPEPDPLWKRRKAEAQKADVDTAALTSGGQG